MSKPAPTLEQKIAAALTAADITAADLAALIQQTEAAITTADKTAEQERAKALDPALSPNPKAAREAMEDAEFARERLKVLLPRLQQRYGEVADAEYEKAWAEDARRVEAMRDAMADELRESYLAAVAKLVDVLSRIPAIDREVDRINGSAPSGISDRLLKVEQKARGVNHFGVSGAWQPNGLLALATDLKLPKFEDDGNSYQYAWPPRQPTMAEQMIFAVPSSPVGVWHEWLAERDRRALEENRRQIAEAEQRQREFEERQRKELESAKERDRQA
jgi:hypothetical protein